LLNLESLELLLHLGLRLHVAEKGLGADGDLADLDGLEPHAPAGQSRLKLLLESLAKFLAILEYGVNVRVRNDITNNGDGHLTNLSFYLVLLAGVKVLSESLVKTVRSVTLTIRSPEQFAYDLNTLHLARNLICLEGNLADLTRECNNLITGKDPVRETDAHVDELSVSNLQHPLASLALFVVLHRLFLKQEGAISQGHEGNEILGERDEEGQPWHNFFEAED
jgi:hypothetical protein